MGEENLVKIKMHRGANQIGGVCTEIYTNSTRLLFDMGAPLEGEGNQAWLDIDGVTTGTTNCDGIFLTHYHGDHIDEIVHVDIDIPVYMERSARKILELQQEHKRIIGEVVWADIVNEIEFCKPIQIKDFTITALESDHSAANSVMYLIEACDKRILLTGDYRLHGFYKEKVISTLKNLEHIDLMITEGTNISRASSYNKDEQWCEHEFSRILSENKYVFLLASSSNIDRIAAFSRCVPKGKYALADSYQTHVMHIADENRAEEYKSFKIHPYREEKKELYKKGGFGMVIRAGKRHNPLVKEFFDMYPDKTCLIYSMWKGYETLPYVAELLEYSKEHIERVHVSGHITKEDLEQVLKLVAPEKLIIHHTSVNNEDENELKIPKHTELLHVIDNQVIEI